MTTPLKTLLLDMLRRSGPITFAHYMELCLYHPENGYYTQNRARTGTGGDYFTSSDLHPIFARLVARQAAEMWEILGSPSQFCWVEMGASRGLFAFDFLRWTARARPDFYAALDYAVIEPGVKVRARLLDRLTQENVAGRIRVLTSCEEIEPASGCFFSNELVDAFPVSIVTRSAGRLKEIYVAADGDNLRERLGPISDSAVAADVARYANQLEEGCRVEVNRRAQQWISDVAGKSARGFVITIDYGDLSEFLYSPARPRGTLMAYRGHVASEDFYSAPGEQDLTAHVNFTALMAAGRQAGLETVGFTTQEKFLMALGEVNQFADLYEPGQTEAEKLDARLKLKRLIFPGDSEGCHGMGTIFKVLVQSRNLDGPRLTGLKFSR